MLQTVRAEEEDGKIWVICPVSMFSSSFVVLKLSKKVHFLYFCDDITKQFTYRHLKVLVADFQKMVLFVLWLIVSEIFGFEIEEFC